ncbi:MAG: hypothetical protein AMXMBFR58_04690 [Phycisphaerae bacterium]
MSESELRLVRIERTCFPDGFPKEEVHWRGESCHGPWREWYENGVLKREWFYDRHVLAQGVHRTWHANGKLETQITVRSGRPPEEIHFDRSGARIPSPVDRMLAAERAAIERAARASRNAKPIKRPRRIRPEEADRRRDFIERLLTTRTAPARAWIAESTPDDPRTLGELDQSTSRLLIDCLLELGAVDVLAVDLQADCYQSAQTTNHLVVVLPADPVARAGILAFDRRLARRNGFTSEGDWGQAHLYMLLC